MDEFLRDIYVSVFKKWVLFQEVEGCTISEEDLEDKEVLKFDLEGSLGEISLHYENCIIELSVTNKKNNNTDFYLHFQMHTLKHAIGLYNEFVDMMTTINEHKTVKVLLSCSSGFTTSFFAEELNKGAETLGIDYHFEAVAYNELVNAGKEYDMILLAPQIAYQLARVQSIFHRIPVLALPSAVFAKYDVGGTFDLIKETLNEKPHKEEKEEVADVKLSSDFEDKILTLGVMRTRKNVTIAYRVYKNSSVLMQGERIKEKFDLRDLSDIIELVLLEHKDLKYVGIATPGVIHFGFLTMKDAGFDYTDVLGYLKTHHPTLRFSLDNDVNAVAAGINAMQEDTGSLSFFYLPKGNTNGSVGSVFKGQLIKGRMNVAGEAQYLPIQYSQELGELRKTERGNLEIVSKNLVSLISLLGPEMIVFYCSDVPDVEELRHEMSKYIPTEYIPFIRKIDNIKEFILFGEMIMCIMRIESEKDYM